MGVRDSAYLDRWWRERLADNDAKSLAEDGDLFAGPLLEYRNRMFGPNDDDLLISVMAWFQEMLPAESAWTLST